MPKSRQKSFNSEWTRRSSQVHSQASHGKTVMHAPSLIAIRSPEGV